MGPGVARVRCGMERCRLRDRGGADFALRGKVEWHPAVPHFPGVECSIELRINLSHQGSRQAVAEPSLIDALNEVNRALVGQPVLHPADVHEVFQMARLVDDLGLDGQIDMVSDDMAENIALLLINRKTLDETINHILCLLFNFDRHK